MKKMIFVSMLLLACLTVFTGCGAKNATPASTETPAAIETPAPASAEETGEAVYKKITAAEARAMMAQAEDYILLDVRSEEEYMERRIEGAILIPSTEIGDRAEAELPDKRRLMFLYCRSGVRSADATRTLVTLGYTNAYDIGGILDWPYDTAAD